MRDSRKFPRFKVANFKHLSGKIDKRNDNKVLVTFGLGGCGFFADEPDPILQPIKRVFCFFEFESNSQEKNIQAFEVQGNLIYLQNVSLHKDKLVYYYGVEFLESHQHLVRPIVEVLEAFVKEGKIEYA